MSAPDERIPDGREPPADVRELNGLLRAIRFEPRASLGAEVEGRLRRGEAPGASPTRSPWGARRGLLPALTGRALLGAALAGVVLLVMLGLAHLSGGVTSRPVTIDRCCFDLDGGGEADDGVRVLAGRDARVRRLAVYEDRDHSGGFTAADLLRFGSGAPWLGGPPPADLVTIRHCCLDFDGGGPRDDGLLVVGAPPDRVVMAAIYELR